MLPPVLYEWAGIMAKHGMKAMLVGGLSGQSHYKKSLFHMFFKVFPARLPRMLLSGIHFNHRFPIKPSEMAIFYTLKGGTRAEWF